MHAKMRPSILLGARRAVSAFAGLLMHALRLCALVLLAATLSCAALAQEVSHVKIVTSPGDTGGSGPAESVARTA